MPAWGGERRAAMFACWRFCSACAHAAADSIPARPCLFPLSCHPDTTPRMLFRFLVCFCRARQLPHITYRLLCLAPFYSVIRSKSSKRRPSDGRCRHPLLLVLSTFFFRLSFSFPFFVFFLRRSLGASDGQGSAAVFRFFPLLAGRPSPQRCSYLWRAPLP